MPSTSLQKQGTTEEGNGRSNEYVNKDSRREGGRLDANGRQQYSGSGRGGRRTVVRKRKGGVGREAAVAGGGCYKSA